MSLDQSVEKTQEERLSAAEAKRREDIANECRQKLKKDMAAKLQKAMDKHEEGQLKSSGPGGKPKKVAKAMKVEKVMKKPARRTTRQQGEPPAKSSEVQNDPHEHEGLADDSSCSSRDGPMEHENAN